MTTKKKLELLKNGLSTLAFANYCDVPESTMRGYLKGTIRNPQLNILQKIGSACNVPWSWLASDTQPPMPDEWKMASISHENLKTLLELDTEVIDIETSDEGTPFPVVKAYDDEDIHLVFYCIHCGTWHSHGRGGKMAQFEMGRKGAGGHRIAHCTVKNSPYKPSGVILDVVGKFKDLNNKRREQKTLFCPKCSNYYSAAFNACECGFVNKKRKSAHPELEKFYHEMLNPLTWAILPTKKGQKSSLPQQQNKSVTAKNGSIAVGNSIAGNVTQGDQQFRNPDVLTLARLLDEFESPAAIKVMIKKYEKLREEMDF